MFLSLKFFRYFFVICSALYIIALFILAVVPFSSVSFDLPSDKWLHFIEFFLLGLLLLITFLLFKVPDLYLLTCVAVLFLTLASEFVQIFVLDRTFSVHDMVVDIGGAAAAFVVFYLGRVVWSLFKR